MDPMIINSLFGLALGGAIGGGMTDYYNQGIMAKNAEIEARYNAKIDEIEAENIRNNAAIQSSLAIEDYKKYEESLRVTAAHSNLQFSGSFLEAALISMKNAAFNAEMIRRDADVESRARMMSAGLYEIQAKSAKLSGRLNKQSSIMRTVGDVGNIGLAYALR